MATTIITKSGSGAPLAGDLQVAELALDLTNKKLYSKEGTTVFEVGATGGGASGTFTDLTATNSFTSVGIDDNATSTAITIDASENVNIGAVGTTTLTTLTGPFNGDVVKMDGSSGVSDRHLIFSNSSNSQQWDIDAEGGASSLGVLSFSTNSTERLRIDSSGNVGIGTASPSRPLSIEGTGTTYMAIVSPAANTAGLLLGDTTSDSQGRIQYNNPNDALQVFTAGSERMRIDSSGNVGIGTTSPVGPLHIQSATNRTLILDGTYPTGSFTWQSIRRSGTEKWRWFLENNDDVTLYADVNSTGSVMRWGSNGNVGIGTSSPAVTLDVFDTSAAGDNIVARLRYNSSTTANTGGRLQFTNQSGSELGYIKSNIESGTAVGLTFGTFSGSTTAERMRIDSSGNVGIGTASPARELVVYHASQPNIVLQNSTSGVGVTDGFQLNFDGNAYVWNYENSPMLFGTNNSERMRIDTSGNLLVGCTSAMSGGGSDGVNGFGVEGTAANKFMVVQNTSNANVYLAKTSGYTENTFMWFYVTGTAVGSIAKSGSGVAYNTTSDQRLKENIVDAPAGNIDAIRVRSFDWKADGTHQTYGMVAQELVDVAPEAVTQGKTDDDVWQVDYSKLVPMMIKEIQDLKAEVAALKGA